MLDGVGGDVQAATGGRQTPWFQSASVGQACLANCVLAPVADRDREAFDRANANGTADGWDAYLRAFPQGRYIIVARNERARILTPSSATARSLPPAPSLASFTIGVIGQAGQPIADIATVARADHGQPSQNIVFELASAGDAAATVSRLKQQRVSAIINAADEPVMSAAIAAARADRIPVLSVVPGVVGNGVYNYARSPEDEAEYLVRFAAGRDLRTFAAIGPDTPANAAAIEALRAAAARSGARLVAQILYPAGGGVAGAQMLARTLAATPARALVLLDGAEAAALAGALTRAGFSPSATKVLGLGGWGEQAPSGAFFDGAWFVTSPAVDAENSQRVQIYVGRAPSARERKVYDMMALSLLLSRDDNALTVAELTNREGFAGLEGVFRFRVDGRVERLYEVRQLDTRGGSTVLSAAARRFVVNAQP